MARKLTKEELGELGGDPRWNKVLRLVSGVYLTNTISMGFMDEAEILLGELGLKNGKVKNKIDNANKSFEVFIDAFVQMMGEEDVRNFVADYREVERALRKFVLADLYEEPRGGDDNRS